MYDLSGLSLKDKIIYYYCRISYEIDTFFWTRKQRIISFWKRHVTDKIALARLKTIQKLVREHAQKLISEAYQKEEIWKRDRLPILQRDTRWRNSDAALAERLMHCIHMHEEEKDIIERCYNIRQKLTDFLGGRI
jgi:hypothetical protein